MKRALFLFLGSAAFLSGADLASVKTVYVMPMARGLDQYLASKLASNHIFQVVTDPKFADAVLTDRIGEAFQIQLDSISPLPVEAKPEQTEAKPAKKEKAGKEENEREGQATLAVAFGDTTNKLENPSLNSAFGRGKGTIFLVEARSRHVVWSTFDPSKGPSGKEMDRTASDIVSRLKKDLNPQSK